MLVPVFFYIVEKSLQVNMRWMPSHLIEDNLPAGVSLTDFLGNAKANLMAGQAANRCCADLNIAASVLFYSSLVKRIQKRLCAICIIAPYLSPEVRLLKTKLRLLCIGPHMFVTQPITVFVVPGVSPITPYTRPIFETG